MPAVTRRLLAVLAVASLAVAGCSTSGGSDADDPTTTVADTPTTDDSPTTDVTPTTDETPTTDGGDEPTGGPSEADLEAALPTVDDLGDGWSEAPDDDDDDDSDTDDTLDEQCPEVAALDFDEDDADDEVSRSFEDADDSQFDVAFSPAVREFDEDQITEYVDAINSCGEVTVEEDGVTTTIAFEASVDDTYGDVGMRIQGDVLLTGDELPGDITLTIYGLIWRQGSVGVEVTIQDGIDPDTFEAIPADTDLALSIADLVAPRITDLVG